MKWISSAGDGVVMNLRVVPRASRTEVAGVVGDAVKLRVCAPPVDGKANAAVVEFLSEALDVSRSRICILAGAKGRGKRVRIAGVSATTVGERLGLDAGRATRS